MLHDGLGFGCLHWPPYFGVASLCPRKALVHWVCGIATKRLLHFVELANSVSLGWEGLATAEPASSGPCLPQPP